MKQSRFPAGFRGGILPYLFSLTFLSLLIPQTLQAQSLVEFSVTLPLLQATPDSSDKISVNLDQLEVVPTNVGLIFDQNGNGIYDAEDSFVNLPVQDGSVELSDLKIGRYFLQIPQGDESAIIPFDVERQAIEQPQVAEIPGGNSSAQIEIDSEPGASLEGHSRVCEKLLSSCHDYEIYCEAENPECVTLCDEADQPEGCIQSVVCDGLIQEDCVDLTKLCFNSPGAIDCEKLYDYCNDVYDRCGVPQGDEPQDPTPTDPAPQDGVGTQTTPEDLIGVQGSGLMSCALSSLGTTPLQAVFSLLLFFVPSLLRRYRNKP